MKYLPRSALVLLVGASLAPALATAQPAPADAPGPAPAPAPAPIDDAAPVPRVTDPPAAGAPAPAPTADAAPALPELVGLAIRGVVTIAGTDTPLSFVEVTVRLPDGSSRTELTGEDGSFTVSGLAAGRHVVRVETPGFSARQLNVDVGPGDATVKLAVPSSETIEITERWRGPEQAMRESAEAVLVVETEKASRESADLGEVLARIQGVGVRRTGGLGSAARFSLAGLVDEQLQFFIDGIPLQLAGFRSGITTIPINFVERIEIYRGVVPVRFGADALGGAFNFVTNRLWTTTQASASYQAGSFGTHRITGAARGRHGMLLTSADVYFDTADNDYEIDVEVPDDRGRPYPATVRRRHDDYRAYGAFVEAGVIDQPWARRLTVRGFASKYDKDLQHNAVMTVPYGEVRYGGTSLGGLARWEQPNLGGTPLAVDSVLAYSFNTTDFVDRSEWIYDWYGERIRQRPMPGETDTQPSDQSIWDHDASSVTNLGYQIARHHQLRANVTVNAARRTGRERMLSSAASRDPLSARRVLGKAVAGVEYEADAWQDRIENIAFAKGYGYLTSTEEVLAGGIFRELDRRNYYGGVGDSARLRVTPWLWAKASYEWTTRLPDPTEVFGDGVLVAANLELRPERSHNANLGVTIDAESERHGRLTGDVNAFARIVDDQVVLLGNDRHFTYQNVYAANSLGAEVMLGWTAPGDWLALDLTTTYTDLRNASDQGTFGDFEGDRIPSRPWLSGNGSVTFTRKKLAVARDTLTASWNSGFVYKYFRGWESQGLREYKQVVPSQLLHAAVLTYLLEGVVDMSFSVELANLTDERAYDFFGVQKPGRSLSFKTTLQY
jgi:vitamin B12 transporter